MKITETTKTSVEEELYNFLLKEAEDYGFSQSYANKWAEYLIDISRGEKIATHLVEYFNIDSIKQEKALDIGCGLGSLLIALQSHFGQVCGLDIQEHSVEWSKKRAPDANVICTNATEIPWSDGEFKLLIANDLFEHLSYEEQEQAVSEMMRVLKSGGYGYIEVPNRFQILDEHNRVLFGTWLPDYFREKYVNIISERKQYLQCWERSRRGWKKLFESQGFQVKIKPHYFKGIDFLRYFFIPPNRFHIYLRK